MRAWRLSLVGTVILVLLGGLAGAVVARTDGSTRVTGSEVSMEPIGEPELSEGVVGEDWVGHGRGMKYVGTFEWSDPRLPSQAEAVMNFEAYGPAGLVYSAMLLLEGPDGHWTGPWNGWCDIGDRCYGTLTLTGHGAHEGFHAVLTARPSEDAPGTASLVGAIVRGEMPPAPEPLEPAAE